MPCFLTIDAVLILRISNRPTLRQHLNHPRNFDRLCAIRFFVRRIRQRIEAAKEP